MKESVARDFRRNSLVLVQKIKPKALVIVLATVKYRKGLGRACHNRLQYRTRHRR